ncbi:MAG TPA: hypothetical protein VJP77_01760, partial [Planctomycetota bacterium]|nr:hypothetical protein [Planctomycetota bacterium]
STAQGGGFPWAPTLPFTWAADQGLGPVTLPVSTQGGWILTQDGFVFRFVPSYSGDPTVEVVLAAPHSGHPTNPERFLLQFPVGPKAGQIQNKALVVGFHPYGLSEKSVFQGTPLPAICASKGWMLIAPYGLVDYHFANEQAQAAADAVLRFVGRHMQWNAERVYAVGFSMGGLSALSFALRHQDPEGVRVAGVVYHTGTGDVIRQYDNGVALVKTLMESPIVFGGSPAAEPFAYERVNPFRYLQGALQASTAQVTNLDGVPFFLHVNNADFQNLDLVAQTKALHTFLQARGFDVFLNQVSVSGMSAHSWSTLPMEQAIAYVEGSTAPGPKPEHGPALRLHADREAAYRFAEVRGKPAEEVARFEVVFSSVGTNAFALLETRDLDAVALDLAAMELDPLQTLLFQHASADSTPDQIVLRGYAGPPSSVLANGLPVAAWSYAAGPQELAITPTAGGSFAVVQVVP